MTLKEHILLERLREEFGDRVLGLITVLDGVSYGVEFDQPPPADVRPILDHLSAEYGVILWERGW